MKKFLKELYKNFPELENSKEDINKAVYYLKDNKPIFSASKEFKLSLKTRLQNISSIKSPKKSSFIVFAVPVFSFLFIVVWFTYYFKEINFLNEVENIEKWLYNIDDLKSEGLIKLDYNVSESNIENDIIETSENLINNKKLLNSNTKEEPILTGNNNTLLNDSINNETSIYKNDNFEIDDENKKDDILFENSDILDVLWALWEMYPDSWESSHPVSTFPYPWDSRMWIESDNIMLKSTSSYIIYDEEYISFDDYCLTNSGAILQNDKVKLCRVKQKYCLSSEYVNWVCEFKEIK